MQLVRYRFLRNSRISKYGKLSVQRASESNDLKFMRKILFPIRSTRFWIQSTLNRDSSLSCHTHLTNRSIIDRSKSQSNSSILIDSVNFQSIKAISNTNRGRRPRFVPDSRRTNEFVRSMRQLPSIMTSF